MSHFAKVENGLVTQVIVAERDFIDSGVLGDPSSWIQTSYRTRGGVHYDSNGNPDDGIALRKNYAGVGFAYDANLDAFIPPKPFHSWLLDEETCLWKAPIEPPEEMKTSKKIFKWNEKSLSWIEIID